MSVESVLEVMKDTLALAREFELDYCSSDTEYCDYEHLNNMYHRVIELNEQDENKLNRLLGWMQASVYNQSNGEISLGKLKQLNKTKI